MKECCFGSIRLSRRVKQEQLDGDEQAAPEDPKKCNKDFEKDIAAYKANPDKGKDIN